MPDQTPAEKLLTVHSEEPERPGMRILALSGHLDAASQSAVIEEIEARRAAGETRFILDFSKVSYVTSAGFAALIEQWRKARELGGELIVLDPPPHVQVLFRVLQQTENLPIARTVADAYASLEKLASLPEPEPTDDHAPGA